MNNFDLITQSPETLAAFWCKNTYCVECNYFDEYNVEGDEYVRRKHGEYITTEFIDCRGRKALPIKERASYKWLMQKPLSEHIEYFADESKWITGESDA